MISKKSRKVVAALLIGATICASGTFAYFNDKLDLSSVVKTDDASNKLNITNGHVEIIGQINGQQSAATNIWSYDVTRLSTVDSINNDATGKFTTAIKAKYNTDLGSVTKYDEIIALDSTKDYVKSNLSPDILGVKTSGVTDSLNYADLKTAQEKLKTAQENLKTAQEKLDAIADKNSVAYTDQKNLVNTREGELKTAQTALTAMLRTDRAKVGDPVVNYISYARPGDAFVLGSLEDGKEASGLEVLNKSNITTKIGLTPKVNSTADAEASMADAIGQLKLLEKAGYKFYIKTTRLNASGTEVDLGTGAAIDASHPAQDYKQLKSTSLTASSYTGILLSNVKPGETLKINMRVELPLDATNTYQDKNTVDASNLSEFDVTKLFDVVVTQENNPGWNENGTNDTPVVDNAADSPKF